MRALIATLAIPVAMLAAVPAPAQVYKWVDERGVVNYSNQPPVSPGTGGPPELVEDRVSVYTPDQALLQAIESERRGGGASRRIAELEQQLEAERRARQAAATATSRRSEPCAPGSTDCPNLGGPYYTPVFVAVRPPVFRPRPIHSVRPMRPARPDPAPLATLPSGLRPILGVAPAPRPRPGAPGTWEWPR